MKKQFSVPNPCHKSWDTMTPDAQGRFCGQCSQTVVDFTAMKADQIHEFVSAKNGTRVCGRFTEQQLNPITVTIPQNVLLEQTHFKKAFLLALLICMGTTLLSCNGRTAKGEVETKTFSDTIINTDSIASPQEDTIHPDTLRTRDSIKERRVIGIIRRAD